MNISKIEFVERDEYYINVNADSVESIQNTIDHIIKDLDITPINQFIFGKTDHFDNETNLNIPYSALNGKGCSSGGMISSQVTAIQSSSIKRIFQNGRHIGSVYEDSYARYIRLVGILPENINDNREKQTISLLNNINTILHQQGFCFKDVVRTWFYLDDLLDWYNLFNNCRTRFFENEKIFDHWVPASTGIGSGNSFGAKIIGDLFAIVPKKHDVKISEAKSPLQGSALEYKSSFSRGIEINFPSHKVLYISGTASINHSGDTIYLNDPEKQIQKTMEVVTEMLKAANMEWDNITRGIAYFKHADYIELFQSYCFANNINTSVISIFVADVCRDNLFYEIEIDAFKKNALY